jgi:proline iminopeptidase
VNNFGAEQMNDQMSSRERGLTLYPEIVPHRTGKLRVSDLHEIYFEECGSPLGKPAVLLHGGPGGGINPVMRR